MKMIEYKYGARVKFIDVEGTELDGLGGVMVRGPHLDGGNIIVLLDKEMEFASGTGRAVSISPYCLEEVK